MKIIEKKVSYYSFYCPACQRGHTITNEWGFNGDFENPTFSAHSIGVGNYGDAGYCHSFITNGHIRFTSDCNHSLAGQTVKLPEFPENYG